MDRRAFARAPALTLAFLAVPLALAAQSDPSSRGKLVTPGDLDGIAYVSGLRISPDGARITFVQQGGIWIAETRSGATPTRVASGTDPVWAPSGAALTYFGRPEGAQQFQVFRYDVRSAQSVQLTNVEGGVVPDGLDWSRNGQLVFLVRVPAEADADSGADDAPEPASAERSTPLVLTRDSPDGYALSGLVTGFAPDHRGSIPEVAELFVHDLESGATRRLTHDRRWYAGPSWSPDGRSVIAESFEGASPLAGESAIRLLDAATGESMVVVPAAPRLKQFAPLWSPDGRRIACSFFSYLDPDVRGVAVLPIRAGRADGEASVVHSGLVDGLAWSADGRALLLSYIDGVARPAVRIDLATGARTVLGAEHTVAGRVTTSRNGTLAWVESTGRAPAVVRIKRAGRAGAEALHDANPQIAEWALGEQEVIRWTNHHGHEREGVLIKPAGYRPGVRVPLIVSAYTQTTHLNAFQAITHAGFGNQAYASSGYAVFFPGPRVPWNYGAWATSEEESREIRGAGGWDVTVDDVESGVDLLIERGIVDPDRMAIIGHSNGGAVAVAVITRTNRYKAAVAVAPANVNWVQNALFRDDEAGRFLPVETFFGTGGTLEEDPEEYVRGSPVFDMHRVETPVLLAVGDRDHYSFTLPTAEMYLALRRLGKDVVFLRYAEQGHSLYGPAGDDLSRRVREFLDRRLRPSER